MHKEKLDTSMFEYSESILTDYIVEYEEDGKTKFYEVPKAGCFGMFRYNAKQFLAKEKTPKMFHSAIRAKPWVRKYQSALYDYIFSPTLSPWRSMIPPDGLHYQYKKSKEPTYVSVPISNDTNMQMIISLLIVARMGTDAPEQLNMFGHLLEKGWEPHEALYTSIYVGLSKDNLTESGQTYDYFAFSARNNNSLEKFKTGTPWIDSKNTFGNGYGPLAKMWFEDITEMYGQPRQNIDFYKKTDGSGKYTGQFKGLFQQQNNSKLEFNVAKVAKLEDILANKKLILG